MGLQLLEHCCVNQGRVTYIDKEGLDKDFCSPIIRQLGVSGGIWIQRELRFCDHMPPRIVRKGRMANQRLEHHAQKLQE